MTGKTKDPALKKDESTTAGKGVAEIDNPEKSNDDSSEDMSADELAAFKKIMGDIDGQEEEKLNGTAQDIGAGKTNEQALTEDELVKLSEEIESINSEDHTDVNIPDSLNTEAARSEDGGDESLDEDQLRAFESIMAQIEGGNDADARSGKETGDAPESENADDFSAELEKVVQESDTAERDEIQNPETTESEDALNEDQQLAFESIMSQIEGGDTKPAATGSAEIEPIDPNAEGKSEDQELNSIGPATNKTDEDSQDISDDIEDILSELTSIDDEPRPPAAAADDPVSEPADLEASEKNIVDDDIVDRKREDSCLEHADRLQNSTSAGENGKPTEPAEMPLAKSLSDEQRTSGKPTPARLKNLQKSVPLRETRKSTGSRQKKAILAVIVALLFFTLVGYFYVVPRKIVDSKNLAPGRDFGHQEAVVEIQSDSQVQIPVVAVHGPSDLTRLKTAAENLDRLRSELIEKQSEIGELRAYYQAGIDAEFQGIADRLRTADKDSLSFKSAIADPRISLGLSAIQRRETYIKKLETPVGILFRNSEELLFFSRRAAVLALMTGKTSDIDIDGFIKQADEIRNLHGSELAQLNIDAVQAPQRALESIWQDVEKRHPRTTVKTENDDRVTNTDNATIWKNICNGDFSRKHMMTALSPDAARCLTNWKGKDLFLNALTDLSPDAARYLAAWEGDWLGLNGLRELSPEAAVHLSRWKGKGISLNSLSRLSPQVVAILSDWQGDQIELVNVKYMAHWENPKTRLFLSEDLKRKLDTTRQ